MADRTDLILRARTGDQAAWRTLYADHAGRLVVWLRSLPTGDVAADAEDVAAEAWMTAARRIKDFDGDASDFAGWLFGIARLVCRNHQRRTGRRATAPYPVEPDAPTMWGITEEDTATRAAGTDLTRRLLAQLPRREAEVVACLDVVGLDVAGAAAALGISRTAVRVAHHRALGRLRRLMTAVGAPQARPGSGRAAARTGAI